MRITAASLMILTAAAAAAAERPGILSGKNLNWSGVSGTVPGAALAPGAAVINLGFTPLNVGGVDSGVAAALGHHLNSVGGLMALDSQGRLSVSGPSRDLYIIGTAFSSTPSDYDTNETLVWSNLGTTLPGAFSSSDPRMFALTVGPNGGPVLRVGRRPLEILGSLYANGSVGIGTLPTGYTLDVGGTVHAGSTLTVDGALAAVGAATVGSTLNVVGAASVGSATVGSTLSVVGAASLGSANVGSTLSVGGAATVGSLNAVGAATVGSLNAVGAATVGSTLYVGGAATFSSTLNAAGAIRAASFYGDGSNVTGVLGIVTPQQFNASAGSGSDDYASINQCLSAAVSGGGGKCYLPPPPSGHYNVCGAAVAPPGGTLPNDVILEMASSSGYDLRILPGCASPPAAVIIDPVHDALGAGVPKDQHAGRMALINVNVNGYCLAGDLIVRYDPGFYSTGGRFLNANAGGVNVLFDSGYEYTFDETNTVKNINTASQACYSAPSDLPAFNIEANFASDFHIGAVAINAEFANYAQLINPGNWVNAHGWGYPPPPNNGDGQPDLRALYTFYTAGIAFVYGAEFDSPRTGAMRMQRVPQAGSVRPGLASIGSAGSGGSPNNFVQLIGTSGTGVKASYSGYVGPSGALVGPLLVLNEGTYTVNPTFPDPVTPVTGSLTGASVVAPMGTGGLNGFGAHVYGGLVFQPGGATTTQLGFSMDDGLTDVLVTGVDLTAGVVGSAYCAFQDSNNFVGGIVFHDNTNCAQNTGYLAPSFQASGTYGSILVGPGGLGNTIGFTNNGQNFIACGTTSAGFCTLQAGGRNVAAVTTYGLQLTTAYNNATNFIPACNGATASTVANVSDATSSTPNTAYVGGGNVNRPVYCDGSVWTIH